MLSALTVKPYKLNRVTPFWQWENGTQNRRLPGVTGLAQGDGAAANANRGGMR